MRHLGDDEGRENTVRIRGSDAFGHSTVEIVEPGANGEKERELDQDHDAAAEQGNARVAQIFGSQQPLHHELIGAVAGHGQEAATGQPRPEGVVLAEAEGEVEDGEFARA